MPSLETIMELLNGSHGAAIFAGLRQAFLLCLALAVIGLLLAPHPGRKQFGWLVFGMWLTLLGLIVGEKLMGIPGMILAPVVLHYIKVEASQSKVAATAAAQP